MDTQRLILRILRIVYKGLRLISGELKTEIDALEKELSAAKANQPETATYQQQS